MSIKNAVSPAGIEPATLRFVVQHLNHFATAVPQFQSVVAENISGLSHFKVGFTCKFPIASKKLV